MTRPLQVAVFCGAIPLTLGSLIYWTWRATRWDWLVGAGLFNILGGLVLFFVGASCLVWHIFHEARGEQVGRRPLGRQAMLIGGLLLINFPAAAFYVLSANDLMTQYSVQVVNESGETIDSFVLEAPGVQVEVGPIPTGGHAQRNLNFEGDGTLRFSAQQHGLHFEGEVEGYVTGNLGGDAIVQIKPGGKSEVHKDLLRD